MPCVSAVILGGLIREARNLSGLAGQIITSCVQKFSASFEELYCFDIACSLASPFPDYIILFVLLGLLPLRGLRKFVTKHVLIEMVSTYFFLHRPSSLAPFCGSSSMVRIFAAFSSCLQVFLLVLYRSYISQANLKTCIFLRALSRLLLSVQPSPEPVHLLQHLKSWLRGAAYLTAPHKILRSTWSCPAVTPKCSK